jgi:ABC-type polysaccharide/polyol phosphate transport system ATPase subunit
MNYTEKEKQVKSQGECAVRFDSVSEKFSVYSHKADSVKEKLIKGIAFGRGEKQEVWALKNISFSINKGEVIGLIGENGSGKTTLLRLIAGILKPDQGSVYVAGKVAAILQLGLGFQRDLSGRENIYLNGAMLGISRRVIDAKIAEIIRFAELEESIDLPLKTYSSGMEMRLGFSIAVHVDPDILLIDEVLIIGDSAFQKKCIRYIEECKTRGKTIILVSHSIELVQRICDTVYVLRRGEIVASGSSETMIHYYHQVSGVREGIGIISASDYTCVFNNGHVYLFYKKELLFPDPGFSFRFASGTKCIHSYNGEWRVTCVTPMSIRAEGFFPAFKGRFDLELWIDSSGNISYAGTHTEEDFDLSLDVRVHYAFDKWFAYLHSGVFLDAEFYADENVFDGKLPKGESCGVSTCDATRPSLVQIVSSQDARVILSRIDSEDGQRGLLLDFGRVKSFSGVLSFSTEIDSYAETVSSNRKRFTITAGFVSLSVIPPDKKIMCTYRGEDILHAEGMLLSFLYAHKWVNSVSALWSVEKISETQIRIEMYFESCELRNISTFTATETGVSVVNATSGVSDLFQDFQLSLLFSEKYSEWVCDLEREIFPPQRNEGWMRVMLPTVTIPQFLGFVAQVKDCPALSFEYSLSSGCHVSVYSLKHNGASRALSLRLPSHPTENELVIGLLDPTIFFELQNVYYGAVIMLLLFYVEGTSVWNKEHIVFFHEGHFFMLDGDDFISAETGSSFSFTLDKRIVYSRDLVWTVEKPETSTIRCLAKDSDNTDICSLTLRLSEKRVELLLSFSQALHGVVGDLTVENPIDANFSDWTRSHVSGSYVFDSERDCGIYAIPLPRDTEARLLGLSSREKNRAFIFRDTNELRSFDTNLYAAYGETQHVRIRSTMAQIKGDQPVRLVYDFLSLAEMKKTMDALFDERSIVSGKMRILFETKKIRFFYGQEELSCGVGMYAVYTGDSFLVESSDAEWVLTKKTPTEIKISGTILTESIRFEWLFRVYEGGFRFSAVTNCSAENPVSQTQFVFLLKPEYTQWFYNLISGICPTIDSTVRWEDLRLPNRDALEYCALLSEKTTLPAVLFLDACQTGAGRLYLYNTFHLGGARALSYISSYRGTLESFNFGFACVEPDDFSHFYSVRFFMCFAVMLRAMMFQSISALSTTILGTDERIRIFHNGYEITGESGLSIQRLTPSGWLSFDPEGVVCERVSDRELSVRFRSPLCEREQELFLILKNETVCVEYPLEALGETVTRCRLVLALSDEYKKGFFNEKTYHFDSDPSVCGVFHTEHLPAIIFEKEKEEEGTLSFHSTENKKVIEYEVESGSFGSMIFPFSLKGEKSGDQYVEELQLRTNEARSARRHERLVRCRDMEIVFEGGYWHIYTQGRRCTTRKGISVRFMYDGRVFESCDFKWTFEKLSENSARAFGSSFDLPLAIEWTFSSTHESYAVTCAVSSPRPVCIDDFTIECIVSSEYAAWILNDKSEAFARVGEHETFEDVPIGRLEASDRLGVLLCEKNALVFSHFSDLEYHPRLLNYKESLKSRGIVISKGNVQVNGRVDYSFSLTPYDMPGLKKMQESEREKRTITCGVVALYCSGKTIALSCRGQAVSAYTGFSTSLTVRGDEYHSTHVRSAFYKQTDRHMRTVHFFPWGEQTIEWVITDDNRLECEVSVHLPDGEMLEDFQFFFHLSKSFENKVLVDAVRCVDLSEAHIAPFEKEGDFDLVFLSESYPLNVRLMNVPHDKKTGVEIDDTHPSFKVLKLIRAIERGEKFVCSVSFHTAESTACYMQTIWNMNLSFWSRRWENVLMWGLETITQSMGLYTSYFVDGYGWQDSIHHAHRTMRKIQSSELCVDIAWHALPIRQEWHVQCVDGCTLEWRIRTTILEKIVFQKEQINVMLSPHYERWSCAEAEGEFPREFNADFGGDWQSLFETFKVSQTFHFTPDRKSQGVPKIAVSLSPIGDEWQTNIVNSDNVFCGRVVRSARQSSALRTPGTYEEALSIIKIEE